jgi:hypothetical protein
LGIAGCTVVTGWGAWLGGVCNKHLTEFNFHLNRSGKSTYGAISKYSVNLLRRCG